MTDVVEKVADEIIAGLKADESSEEIAERAIKATLEELERDCAGELGRDEIIPFLAEWRKETLGDD